MDAIAIQDANKIRIAMGLAPLPVPGGGDGSLSFKASKATSDSGSGSDSDSNDHISTLEKRQAAAGDNWARLQAEERARLDRQARKEAAKKQRDAVQRFAKLEGKGLGDADGHEELDTKAWLRGQKKRQAKIDQARRYEEEQAAREHVAEYTAKDLAGVKVGHELGQFDEAGGEQILTLKDAEIGDGGSSDEDELENADMREREKLAETLELKKKKPVYDPNAVDETGDRSILKHYDEEIDGKKRKRFTLDGKGGSAQAAAEALGAQDTKTKGIKINLDMLKDDTPVSDYLDASTAKIRKPKKKKAKTSRTKMADEDDIFPIDPSPAVQQRNVGDGMDVDGATTNTIASTVKRPVFELDDDDLQAQLAQQRRLALKKRKKTDAAELARQFREEASTTPAANETDGDDDEGPGMIIDETTEFVANLQRPGAPEETKLRPASPDGDDDEGAGSPDADGDSHMQQSYGAIDDEPNHDPATASTAPVTSTGFEEESTLSTGIGASLSMLRKRGLMASDDGAAQNTKDRARDLFLAENRQLITDYDLSTRDQRERDRQSGRFDRMSARERETYAQQQNESRERFLAGLQAEHFRKSYKPDVKLKYNDEFGREMNQKEAFKHLSHMFHGKGSGKQKTEKRLKKIEDERARESKSSLDASQQLGLNSAMGATARKNRQAGVRLQ